MSEGPRITKVLYLCDGCNGAFIRSSLQQKPDIINRSIYTKEFLKKLGIKLEKPKYYCFKCRGGRDLQ